MGLSIFVFGGNKKHKMVHWMLWMFTFSHTLENWVTPFRSECNLEYISNMIWCWSFFGRLISLFPNDWTCLIWLNIHLLSPILVLTMSLYLRAAMTFTLLHLPTSCWPDMASNKCRNVVDSFLPMLRIQTLVPFIADNSWFHELFFVYWDI